MGRRFASARALALDVSPLRESPAYRALWIGQIVSLAGTQMRYVAVAFQVFALTGSTAAVGLLGLVEVVPLIVFSIIGGGIADRYDRRTVVARAQIGLIVASAGLAAVSLADRPSLAWIYGLTALSSAFGAVDRPARTAMVPQLVGEGKLAAAMALRQVAFQVTQIAGPALGGVLLAALGGDVVIVYGIDAVTFFAALIALRWVPSMPPAADVTDAPGLELIREGLRFSFRNRLILPIFLIDLVAMIFGMPRAVFPELAEQTFGIGASGLGLLYASPAAGALVGALTTGWVTRVSRQGLAVIVAVVCWGVAITLAGLTLFSLWLTMLLLALAGAADVVSAVFRGTILQEATPDHLRGRVSAVNLMVVTGGPRLGDVEAGVVADLRGAPASIVIGGAACLAGTAVVAGFFPALRNYETVVSDAAPTKRTAAQ